MEHCGRSFGWSPRAVLEERCQSRGLTKFSRIVPMYGFKVFKPAAVTIVGIELLHCIHKGPFDLGRLGVQGQAAPTI